MVAPARQTDPSLQDVPRGMLAAAALLIGLASLIGLAGLATVAAALATAARRWYSRADLAPADLTRLKWEQVKAAEIAFEGVQQELEVGSRTTLDVLNQQQELLNARVALTRSERDEVVAGFALLAAVGRLTAKELGLPVQLYDPVENYEMQTWRPLGAATYEETKD